MDVPDELKVYADFVEDVFYATVASTTPLKCSGCGDLIRRGDLFVWDGMDAYHAS